MKRITLFLLLVVLLPGCDKYLDTENLTQKNTSNYPDNELEAQELLTGVYSAARKMEMDPNGLCSFVVSEILSDDRFSGGGPDDKNWANIEKFVSINPNMFKDTWANAYSAIYRANTLLESLKTSNIKWTGAESRQKIEAQAHFLRAYSYFYLARFFGTAPLVLSTEAVNLPKASAEDLFAQIGSDLEIAIQKMPNTQRTFERGRASKWAAEALIARVFLFYTGYYKKEAMPLFNKGTITRQKVIGYIDDCITNSGHSLHSDFRNLWPYSNNLTKQDGYKYSVLNNLNWVGEQGGNNETIFAFHSSAKVNWDNMAESNRINLYFSIREQDEAGIFPFGKGWGFGTVNPLLCEKWPKSDLRYKGSVIDVRDTENEMPHYQWAADHQQDESGYWQKKYIAVNIKKNGSFFNYSKGLYGDMVNDDYQINNTQDLVLIRYADVLLMSAELKKDNTPLNLVRARAGLNPISYSEEALRNERRWELAFEGIRYYDLLRWGIAAEALSLKNGVEVRNDNVLTKKNIGNVAQRIKDTGGFMPLPQEQVALSNGVLVQTKGW